jgi:aspartyl-tRNA(Asn)/glutamyl-tRNA(Gln) amidotransferase subunit C
MKISKDEVLKVAALARLDLEEASIEPFVEQISTILDYVDTLKNVDTKGVPATSHAISLTNAFREDEPHEHLDRDRALENAPEIEDGTFTVPRII